jgi:hypothetical protein
LVVFSVADNVYSQKQKIINLQGYDNKPYHFGFILGYNYPLFSSCSDSLNLGKEIKGQIGGFTVGILANLRLSKHFDLRFVPSLMITSGDSIIAYNTSINDSLYNDFNGTIYFSLPLEIKARSKRYNNMAAYILAGFSYVLLTNTLIEDDDTGAKVKLPKSDYMPEVGVGVDIYTEYFKFGIEAKMAYGLVNMNKQTKFRDGTSTIPASIAEFHSKIFFLTFTFE